MKFLWLLMIIATSLLQLRAEVDVERTITQVLRILNDTPQLPRLTRDEILQLLKDIRAEDEKLTTPISNIDGQETTTVSPKKNYEDNEISPSGDISDEEIFPYVNKYAETAASTPEKTKVESNNVFESTTEAGKPALMVVLPYTPADGSSLQELYTRPPRVKVFSALGNDDTRQLDKISETKKTQWTQSHNEAKVSEKLYSSAQVNHLLHKTTQHVDMNAELRDFLLEQDSKRNSGINDHFLLPIMERFKPLPPAKVVDGSVELPENILLTYDLIPDADTSTSINKGEETPSLANNFMFEPLKPEYPFEFAAAPSNDVKTVLPLDLPKTRQSTHSESSLDYQPKLEANDETVKVLPLRKGLNPIQESSESDEIYNELKKRQTNNINAVANISLSISSDADINNDTNAKNSESTISPSNTTSGETSNTQETTKDSMVADSDTGASIADLEDSFGGPLASQPGDSMLPPQRKNGFYWMLDWNSFLEVGDGDQKVNIRLEPKLGDPQMFLPVTVP